MALDVCRNARRNGLDLTLVTTGWWVNLENDFFASGVDYVRFRRRLPVDLVVMNFARSLLPVGFLWSTATRPWEALQHTWPRDSRGLV